MLKQRVITAVVLLAFLLPALFAPMAWPFAVTANSEVAGAMKAPLALTKFQTETGAGSASLVVMRCTSRIVGEITRRLFSPVIGRRGYRSCRWIRGSTRAQC